MRYYIDLDKRDYYLPVTEIERFCYLDEKIKRFREGGYSETERGYSIVFDYEFSQYRIRFRVGDIWYKGTESWQGNGGEEVIVRIVRVTDSFIYYREVIKKFGINFSRGRRYALNKWSFLRIFREG